MANFNSKNELLKQLKQRRYLNKDFDGLRNDLLSYARTYFPDRIQDFSEASLGGMLLDFAAYVGDVQSFYLDHQYHETFPETSTEVDNIDRHLRRAGVPIVGAAPAVLEVSFFIRVPATADGTGPDTTGLPIIKQNTIVRAGNGIEFTLTENLDFNALNTDGSYKADINIGSKNANNVPQNFIMALSGICISGKVATEYFSLGTFQAFKTISLANSNVSEVISVTDSLGNEYYEVDYLTQDTIYKAVTNIAYDNGTVPENIVPIPAPYRFTKQTSLQSRNTSLTLGGGSAVTLNDDVIPDPSEFSLPLYGKRTFSRFTINPEKLLQTTTFGVVSENTTLTVQYRYGGGLNHNVDSGAIESATTLYMEFPNNPTSAVASFIRNSVNVSNIQPARGGEVPPSIDELKSRIPAFQSSQNRIVTKEDLLARVYTLPGNFGRVFRASIQTNPTNPLAAQLFIICRNFRNELVVASDSLKKNLAGYLNQYRMISDAIDILDVRVVNLGINFTIVVDPNENKELVLKNVLNSLKSYANIAKFDIDQPLVVNDIQNIIFNSPGVVNVVSLAITNIFGTVDGRAYSNQQFDIVASTSRGIIFGPPGSMFEFKFKDYDITGVCV